MEVQSYLKTTLLLGLAGVLFSGYLSAVKLFTEGCALNETCALFFGYPSCYFGFGLFLLIFLAALLGMIKVISAHVSGWINLVVSFLGILFAGSFAIPETQSLLAGASRYDLGLSSCTYGLVFFVIVLALAVKFLKTPKK